MFEFNAHDPLVLFQKWIDDAWAAGVPEADAMALATATRDGIPSSRFVLFKGIENGAILFYTNYTSRKSNELDTNPRAALSFYWPAVKKQLRVEGSITRSTREQSDRYFKLRPRGSQVAAMASHQSQPIADRSVLESRVRSLEEKFVNVADIPCPEFWGGYALLPTSIEFWSAGEFRLHDRVRFLRLNTGWRSEKLSP